MGRLQTDVLVVGAGPSGLTAALSLARQGVRTLAIAKHAGTAHTPRAHITNQRTMEVFRDLGVEERAKEIGWPLSYLHNNVLATSLAGQEIARYKSYGTPTDRLSDYAAASPCASYNIPQHVLDPVLLAAARESGAEFRFLNELVAIQQTPEMVIARIRDRATETEYEVEARYVVAADGANSLAAQQLAFEFKGQAGLRGMANSWLEVDLSRYTDHRPGVIYWIAQPGYEQWFGTASWINVRPWNEWSLLHPWDTSKGPPSEEDILARARITIGDPNIPIKVKAITTWQVNNVVATGYRKGRVFLAGDAAHRHPPTGGLGTNTSVQDSYNLAWKLALVLRGKAGDALLDSYSEERQPVGQKIVERAIVSFENMAALVEALGFEAGQSVEDGWAALKGLYAPGAQGAKRRHQLSQALKLQNYRSNALGVELGQRYISNATIDDGAAFPPHGRDADLYYEATTHPGAHIPHAWIEVDQKRTSTVELVGNNRFSLIVGVDGEAWKRAAETVSEELSMPLPVFQIGLRCPYDDVTGEWERVREIDDQGAILVRPDRFVAWRSVTRDAQPVETLRSALRKILGLDGRRS